MKTYILDTNIILHSNNILNRFKNCNVIIPVCVLKELDGIKTKKEYVGYKAREFIRTLHKLIGDQNIISKSIKIGNKINLKIVSDAEGYTDLRTDEKIIQIASEASGTLITRDISMKLLASSRGVNTTLMLEDKIDIDYQIKKITVSKDFIDLIHIRNTVNINKEFEHDLSPNDFVILESGESQSKALCRYFEGDFLEKLDHSSVWGVQTKTAEQICTVNILTDPNVELVSITGASGSGKTYLALAAGLEQVLEEKKYDRIVIVRPMVNIGHGIGFLPGTAQEKVAPWVEPIKDNLMVLFKNQRNRVEQLFETGDIQVEPITFMRGRSIANSFIILDEAQNLNRHEIKTLLTRAAQGSKIVLTGDIDQIDDKSLSADDNGLSYVIEKFRDFQLAGHISLHTGYRSQLATLASQIL